MRVDMSGQVYARFQKAEAEAKHHWEQGRGLEAAAAYRRCADLLRQYAQYGATKQIKQQRAARAQQYQDLADRIEAGTAPTQAAEAGGTTDYDAEVLTASRALADFYEAAVAAHENPKAISNWVMADVIRVANERAVNAEADFSDLPVRAEALGKLVALIDNGTISGKIAKTVFDRMIDTGDDPATIVEREGLVQESDEGKIASVIDAVLAANPDKVAEFRSGKDKLLGFFVGLVMRETKGKANPQLVNKLLANKLK